MATVRILIVEDETIVAQDIAVRLERAGYHVAALADTGESALEALKQHPIDLALLDIHLIGEMDGVDLAKVIRQRWHIPLIYLTSLSDPHTVERARFTRPSAYMLKPFNDRELEIAIDMAVQNFSSGTAAAEPEKVASIIDEGVRKDGHFFLEHSIFIKDQYRYQRLDLEDLLWAEASGNYTELVSREQRFVVTAQLHRIEERLPYPPFLRVHRSFLVNLRAVTALEGNQLMLGDKAIPVSKAFHEAVFRHFSTL